jgi:GrpB-like predicted nucleotidyltransferase (UPF0157 family)
LRNPKKLNAFINKVFVTLAQQLSQLLQPSKYIDKMKIQFEKYNPNWKHSFEVIKDELIDLIGFINPNIEHIGSTSVEGLSAKPIIDILIGVKNESDLDKTTSPLINNDYIYYEKYNDVMPYRRFFVKLKVTLKNSSLPTIIQKGDKVPTELNEHYYRLAHIHVLQYNSEHWIRHIAFRDYLRIHSKVKNEYQKLKELLSTKEWTDGNEYNEAKDKFLKIEEQNAIKWYKNSCS